MNEVQNLETPKPSVEKFNLITAFISLYKKYAVFKGRSRRSEYWFAYLSYIIVYFVLYLAAAVADVVSRETEGGHFLPLLSVILMCVRIIFNLASIVPWLAMRVRRLHDTGRSGKLVFLPLAGEFIAIIGAAIIMNTTIQNVAGIALLFAGLLGFLLTIISGTAIFTFTLFDSIPGDNKYGPNPKGIAKGIE